MEQIFPEDRARFPPSPEDPRPGQVEWMCLLRFDDFLADSGATNNSVKIVRTIEKVHIPIQVKLRLGPLFLAFLYLKEWCTQLAGKRTPKHLS